MSTASARLLVAAALGVIPFVAGCRALDDAAGLNHPKARPAEVKPENDGREPAVATERGGADAVAKAKALADAGNYDAALAEFERAIADNPRLTTAYLGAGDIYRKRGDFESAEARYGKAAEVEPASFDAQYLHGLSLQLLNRLSDSVRAYLRALSLRPDDFSANLNLGTAYLQLGEPQEALAYAQRAVELNTADAPARINLGAVYSALNRHQDAVIEYQQASELTELSAPLLLNLAESLGKSGRYEEMVNTLEQLVQAEPTAVGYERLGMGLFRLKRYSDSLAAFRKSLEIDPNHFPALNGVGVCLANEFEFSGREDEEARKQAVDAWRRSLRVEMNQPKILELLSRYQ